MLRAKHRKIRITYSVDGVELPGGLEIVEAIGIDVLIDAERSLDPEVHDHETLCSDLERQDFDSVGDEQTGPCECVCDGEDPDHGDDGAAGVQALGGFLLRGADCPNDEG